MSYILGGVEEKPIGESEDLEAIADEVEAGRGPVAVVRPGHRPVVLVSAEDWQRLDELESAESTAWWRRDAAERRDVTGEGAHDGEHEPGIDEEEFRRRFCTIPTASAILSAMNTLASTPRAVDRSGASAT
jgi:PHD/YefM family antitoxin component YafN of YafNO toxin-antitoxin module